MWFIKHVYSTHLWYNNIYGNIDNSVCEYCATFAVIGSWIILQFFPGILNIFNLIIRVTVFNCLVNNFQMVLDIKEMKDNGAFGGPINFLWWIVKSVCLPLSIPWLIYRFISNMHLKTRMSGLKDKVTIFLRV